MKTLSEYLNSLVPPKIKRIIKKIKKQDSTKPTAAQIMAEMTADIAKLGE